MRKENRLKELSGQESLAEAQEQGGIYKGIVIAKNQRQVEVDYDKKKGSGSIRRGLRNRGNLNAYLRSPSRGPKAKRSRRGHVPVRFNSKLNT